MASSHFSSDLYGSTPAHRASFRIAEIDFDNSPRFHRTSKALYVPKYFHKFILPTLPEQEPLPMEPLNWEFGVRVDRPFERLQSTRRVPGPRPPPRPFPSRRERYHGGAVRAQDAFEQPNFWDMPAPLVDPYNQQTEEEEYESGPLKVWFEMVMVFLVALWELFAACCSVLLDTLTPFIVSVGKALAERLQWRTVISLLLATQLVRLLPGLEGSVEAGVEAQMQEALGDPAPLYVIRIPVTRLAL